VDPPEVLRVEGVIAVDQVVQAEHAEPLTVCKLGA
jgi:hypothetical protein